MRPPHLLLVGGGHAVVAVLARAAAWVRAGARVTLLSDCPHLYYSGMVPEMLGGVYRAEEARIDLPRLCREHGVAWREGRATAIDSEARAVVTEGGGIEADLVALNVGSATRGGGRAEGAVLAKPLHRAEELLRGVEGGGVRRVVIVGGGAAGVEVALNLSARPCTPPLSLTLVEPAGRLLPGLPDGMGRRALDVLTGRGVDVRLRTPALSADTEGGGVRLEGGGVLPADEVFWAAGPVPPPLLAVSPPLPLDDRGYLRVTPALRVPGHPWLFAAGDCAAVEGHEDLARIGVHAVKQGPVLAENLDRSLRALGQGGYPDEKTLRPFRPYPLAPLILSTGEREGWWVAGPVWLRGAPMLRLKHLVDLRWMRRYAPLPRFDSPARMAHTRSASDP